MNTKTLQLPIGDVVTGMRQALTRFTYDVELSDWRKSLSHQLAQQSNQTLFDIARHRFTAICDNQLATHIHSAPVTNAYDDLVMSLIPYNVPPRMVKQLTKELSILLETSMLEMVGHVRSHIVGEPFGLWTVSLTQEFIEIKSEGDYRILEWERDHLDEDGCYKE